MSMLEGILLLWACVASGVAWYYRSNSMFYMDKFIGISMKVVEVAEGKANVVINKTTGKIDLVYKGKKK